MATLITDADPTSWQLLAPKPGRQMSIASIRNNGQPPRVQLTPKTAMGSIWTPFQPSVYQGTGGETRKSIVYSIPDDVRRCVEGFEEWIRDSLRPTTPNIDSLWISSVKPPSNYAASLKSKITLSGPGACAFVDEDGRPVDPPEEWGGRVVIPILEVRAAYLQRASAGIILETIALMVGPLRKPSEPAPMEFL
jgi:hypothetical protein